MVRQIRDKMKRPLPNQRAVAGLAISDLGCGLWTNTGRERHRFVGAVFELDGHEHHFAVAEVLQIMHLELAFTVGLVAGSPG